jgi:hypothetical protein
MVKGLNARQIKLVACVSMMFSHIGIIFWPQQLWWQIPGRLAFPLFAFMIANGARYSQNVYKYLARLLIFAVLIQYPYSIFLASRYLNICFTLGLGLAAILAWRSALPVTARLAALLAAGIMAEGLGMEYGWYGIAMIFCAHLFFEDKRLLLASWFLFNIPYLLDMASALLAGKAYPPVQGLCLLAFPFVLLYNGQRGGGSRWEFYAFYIGHLALLYAVRIVVWGF